MSRAVEHHRCVGCVGEFGPVGHSIMFGLGAEHRRRPDFASGEYALQVAAIRDLCHIGIVGWAMDGHAGAELVST